MHEKHGTISAGVALAAMLLLVAVLYALSFGPAQAAVARGALPQAAIDAVYQPIFFAASHSTTANRLFNWYWSLWMPVSQSP